MTSDDFDAFVLRAAYDWLKAERGGPGRDVARALPVAMTISDDIALRGIRGSLERLARRGLLRIGPGRSNLTYDVIEVTPAGRAYLERVGSNDTHATATTPDDAGPRR